MREIFAVICTAGCAACGAGLGMQTGLVPPLLAFAAGLIGGFGFWVVTIEHERKP